MRDQLWTEVISSTPVDDYFPMFDFDQLPAFPAVLWGVGSAGVLPLPRYVQPVDNGIHNVRLAEDNYDRPRLVPVALCNPGPGGGMSNPSDLTIAAPVPVIASVEPDGMSPLDVVMDDDYFDPDDIPVARPVELVVRGPHHVPTFHGYEEPKYGNFNASSVVRFDGMDLPTTFTSSGLLTAELPAAMALEGTHYVTVFTPSNGTGYFEELRDGSGDIVFQGHMPSGGESAPYLFTVAYRPPTITGVSPDVVPLNAPGFDDSEWMSAPASNFTIMGSDFREGAVVRVDGNVRVTTYVNSHMLQVKLLPEDAAAPGDRVVVVTNPGIGSPQAETVLRVSDTPLTPARAPAQRRRPPNRAAGAGTAVPDVAAPGLAVSDMALYQGNVLQPIAFGPGNPGSAARQSTGWNLSLNRYQFDIAAPAGTMFRITEVEWDWISASSAGENRSLSVQLNGASGTTVYASAGGPSGSWVSPEPGDFGWQAPGYATVTSTDLSTARLRFSYGGNSPSSNFGIDNVIVRGIVIPPPCPGDANGDNLVDFEDLNIVLGAWDTEC